jgi:hypothetical protein
MELHENIKEILTQYGLTLLKNNTLVNFMSDSNCFNEFRPAKQALKSILSKYGEEIYNLKINNSVYENRFNQMKHDFHQTSGVQLELVDYLYDSIAFSINWNNDVINSLNILRRSSLNNVNAPINNNKFLFYATLYHHFGINITSIMGKKGDCETYLYPDPWGSKEIRHPFKEPADKNWKQYFSANQTMQYIQRINWDSASGIGAVIGYNGLRALDFDNITMMDQCGGERSERLDRYVEKLLSILGLPSDYQWVVLSGSGLGIHIIFRTEDLNDFSCSSVGFIPNKTTKINHEDFERVELRWQDHLVLPPSRSINYYTLYEEDPDTYIRFPQLLSYNFYFGSFPNTPPQFISIDNLNNILNYLAAEVETVTYVQGARILGLSKRTTNIDSWFGQREIFRGTHDWCKSCKSNGNEEYIIYLLRNQTVDNGYLEKAVQLLKDSDSSICHYNLSSLIANNVIIGTKDEAINHYNHAKANPDIASEDLEFLASKISEMS